MTTNLSVPAYGFSLHNEERCEQCRGGGIRDVPGEARQVVDETGTIAVFNFRGKRPPMG